jgi:nucleotide-binding universal stress UspA family protein
MSYATLMAHVELGLANDHLLRVTASLARRLNAGVLGVAAAQPIQIPYGEVYSAGDLLRIDRDEIAREVAEAEMRFRAALRCEVPAVDWRSAVTFGPLADYLCSEARGADLIITRPDRGGLTFDGARRTGIGDLVMRAGRPVLVVPEETAPLTLTHAMIAWKDTRESRRAVADALPLLECAGEVSVVEIAHKIDLPDAEARVKDVADWLKGHGVGAQAEAIEAHGDAAQQLDGHAERKGADLMVAGAYGHARLREWVFGGVTSELLMHPRRCTLLSH